jgi:hypothetical protein
VNQIQAHGAADRINVHPKSSNRTHRIVSTWIGDDSQNELRNTTGGAAG